MMRRFFATTLLLIVIRSALMVVYPEAASRSVEQWGIFELSEKGPSSGNPFVDVRFSALWSQGDVRIESQGFYDGDGIYRVRFMPEKQGRWGYLTRSNRPELDGKTG